MIILALDPGSTMTGWAKVDVRGARPRPITLTFLGGGHAESSSPAIGPLMHDADIVAVEKIEGIAYAAKGGGIVGALVASSSIAGGIAWLARERGHRVVEMTARAWRGLVLGRPQASDQQIKAAIPGLIHGMPKTSNCHVRDALGLAVGVAWSMGGAIERKTA